MTDKKTKFELLLFLLLTVEASSLLWTNVLWWISNVSSFTSCVSSSGFDHFDEKKKKTKKRRPCRISRSRNGERWGPGVFPRTVHSSVNSSVSLLEQIYHRFSEPFLRSCCSSFQSDGLKRHSCHSSGTVSELCCVCTPSVTGLWCSGVSVADGQNQTAVKSQAFFFSSYFFQC